MKQDDIIDSFIKDHFRFGIIKYLKIPYSFLRFIKVFSNLSKGKGVYISSLPKSGSSWLEQMLSDYYEMPLITFPDSTIYEIFKGNSHTNVSKKWHIDFTGKYQCIHKNHTKFSKKNLIHFKKNNLIPIVLQRNIFNVIKSHIIYVKKTPYHPEFKIYKKIPNSQCVDIFIENYLYSWIEWFNSWNSVDLDLIKINYEELRKDTFMVMYNILTKLDKTVNEDKLNMVIDKNDASRIKKNQHSFFNEGKIEIDLNFFNENQITKINYQLKNFMT